MGPRIRALIYSQVNSLRVWTSLKEYAPIKDFNQKNEVNSLRDFELLKIKLRSSPEANEFINWEALLHRYEVEIDESGNNSCNRIDIPITIYLNIIVHPLSHPFTLTCSFTKLKYRWWRCWPHL